MIKSLLLGATLATAALAAAPVLADPGHRHGQNTACGANCPAATAAADDRGQHGMRHGGRHAARGDGHGKGAHGAQRGQGSEGCPMHSERKPA